MADAEKQVLLDALLEWGVSMSGDGERTPFDALARKHGVDVEAVRMAILGGDAREELDRQLAIPVLRRLVEQAT